MSYQGGLYEGDFLFKVVLMRVTSHESGLYEDDFSQRGLYEGDLCG